MLSRSVGKTKKATVRATWHSIRPHTAHMHTIIVANTAPSPPTPVTPPPRSRNAHRWLLSVLAGLVFIAWASLLLEGSTLPIDATRGSRNSKPDALWQHQAPNDDVNTAHLGDLLPSWAVDVEDSSEVPEDERLHLSLLHATCTSDPEAVIPWRHGAPGSSQDALMRTYSYSSSASNDKEEKELKAELIHRDDPQLLEKLRACPDVDIFLPAGLRGNGYCEDACAYAKCELMSVRNS
jgi:hypothetical protein